MPRDEARTIKVRCATWDQVEAFYTQKLKGDTLVVKMPIRPELGDGVTVALGLPSGLVFAVDGSVTHVGDTDVQGKYAVAMKMHGLTREVRDRLARLVRDGREGLLSALTAVPAPEPPAGQAAEPAASAPEAAEPPVATDGEIVARPELGEVSDADRAVFEALTAYGEAIRGQATHEILGVPYDADLRAVRAGYFSLARRYHPDVFGRHRSPALRALACEVFIHINRAYDRLREAVVRREGARFPGPAATGGTAWLVDESDVRAGESAGDEAPATEVRLQVDDEGGVAVPEAPAAAAPAVETAEAAAAAAAPVAHERTAPRTLADQLFGDMGGEDEKRDDDRPGDAFDSIVPAGTEQALSLANAGRAAFAAGQYELARGHFAAALKVDPRNRPVRALYHVASGFVMRARGQDAEAQLQFETALGHDPACHEAQRALGRTARRA